MPTYSLWEGARHFPVFPVELSRGCKHRCPFCSDPVLRRGATSRGGGSTLDVLRALCDVHGEVFVRFVDSSFSSMRPDIDVLLGGIVAEELPVRWSAYAYASDLDAELVELMRSSGCRALFFGMESLSPDVMTGKRFTRDAERIEATLQMLAGAGIFAHCNFIVGLPGETRDTLRRTIDRIATLAPDSVGGGPFYLTPGSTFHRRPERFGIKVLDEDWILRQHETFDEPGHEYFATDTLTQSEMWALADEFRTEITSAGESCWNLSDYALICWEAVGGSRQRLKDLWRADEEALSDDERLVVQVLKEKVGTEVEPNRAAGFVDVARMVATR
ncbi:MAG: B12-binding domain-containing radical SAM protein [Solirubrobacterales bacterium]